MAILQIKYRADEVEKREMVDLPLSKSIALRVMTLNGVCRAFKRKVTEIPVFPDAGDVAGLKRGLDFYAGSLKGKTSLDDATHIVNIGEGGAPLRFFTALAASTPGIDVTLHASKGLMRRPLMILLQALREAGADIRCERKEGYPPIRIIGKELNREILEINPAVSSQYISALMMASLLWRGGLNLRFEGGAPVSLPYIEMTSAIMERFGAVTRIEKDEDCGTTTLRIPAGAPSAPPEFPIEPDWSAASYFYETALLLPGVAITLKSLTPAGRSIQGDARCGEIMALVGVETIINSDGSATLLCDPSKLDIFLSLDMPLELDMNHTPDLVPALTVGFALSGIKFRFTSVGHLRHKETDRLSALATEMEKLGYMLEIEGETLAWTGRRVPGSENESISTYSDHRMAMAFAPAAARLPYISIEDPDVVGKSFPRYWEMLRRIGFQVEAFTHKKLIRN